MRENLSLAYQAISSIGKAETSKEIVVGYMGAVIVDNLDGTLSIYLAEPNSEVDEVMRRHDVGQTVRHSPLELVRISKGEEYATDQL